MWFDRDSRVKVAERCRVCPSSIDTAADPIWSVMLGDVKLAKEFSARLFEYGVFAMALGFPTVPRGQARIRVMNTAAHTREDLDKDWRYSKR